MAQLLERGDWENYVIIKQTVNKTEAKKDLLLDPNAIAGCHIEVDKQHSMTIKHHWEEDEGDAETTNNN